jgi:hypothetical protein
MSDLIIIGDEAWTPEEYQSYQRRRERERRYDRARWHNPERQAYHRRYIERWRAENPDYHREWMRRYRARKAA